VTVEYPCYSTVQHVYVLNVSHLPCYSTVTYPAILLSIMFMLIMSFTYPAILLSPTLLLYCHLLYLYTNTFCRAICISIEKIQTTPKKNQQIHFHPKKPHIITKININMMDSKVKYLISKVYDIDVLLIHFLELEIFSVSDGRFKMLNWYWEFLSAI
jgi:hypothetical protein